MNPPYPNASIPPGYPTGSTLPPGYSSYPPNYPTSNVMPSYPNTTVPPGYPMSYPPGGYNPAPGYPSIPHAVYPAGQGIYPPLPAASAGYVYPPQDMVGYVFRLTEAEGFKRRLDVKYSPSMDKYVRVSDHGNETIGWRTQVYAEQNIMRKVEQDWHMAYLARQENAVFGRIEWRFDSSDAGLRVKRLQIKFPTKLYEDGHVNAYIASERGDMIPVKESEYSQDINGLTGVKRFSIIAELSRGKGEHAWQHAQLFRQKLKPGFFSTDDSHYPFRISVDLE